MASITQYRGKTWRAIIRKTGFKPISKTFSTKAQAQAWATKTEAGMLTGVHRDVVAEARQQSVRDLFEKFRDEVVPTRKGGRWEKTRINMILRTHPFVEKRLDQIGASDIRDWRDDRLKAISPASVNREMNLVSGVFTHAIKEWGAPVPANPVHQVARPKGNGKHRNRRWSQREIDLILTHSNHKPGVQPTKGVEYVGWALLLALETAMRLGEIVLPTKADYHRDERRLHLKDTKNGDERDVPLSTKALEILDLLTADIGADDQIFPFTSETLGVYFRDVRAAAGLKKADLHFHDSRHEAATRLSKKLTNVLELSAVTGHRSLQSLKRYYNPTAAELASRLD